MVNIVPYYRAERNTVILRVFVKEKLAKAVSTGIKIDALHWNEAKRQVAGHPNAKLFNQKIQNRTNELIAELTRAELLGAVLTKERVKHICDGRTVTADFYKHCKSWIAEKYSNKASRNAMFGDLEKLHTYSPSLQFGDVDARFLMRYRRYLEEDLKQAGNTIFKAFKFIRTMLYDAEKFGGIAAKNPFKTAEFKMPRYRQPEKDGLHTYELDAVEKILLEPHPVVIRAMAAKFLLMCYTGWRISDAKRFDFDENIKEGRMVMTSKKTKISTNLKVFGRLQKVLGHLKDLPEKNISDQKFNQYLETVQELSGITRLKFTSHLGRHTFGCLLAEAGVSEEEAMELMGVKNKSVIRVYYKLRQPQIDRAADRLNSL